MIEKLLNQFPAVGKCKNLIGRPGPTVVGVELVDDVSGNLVLVGGQPQKIVVNLIFKINNKFDFGTKIIKGSSWKKNLAKSETCLTWGEGTGVMSHLIFWKKNKVFKMLWNM